MNQYMVEGRSSGLLQGREYHTDHPEENNIISCDQNIRREEIIHLRGLFRPAQRRERPQGRGKPGIQRILILSKVRTTALRAFFRRSALLDDHLSALLTVICRDAVPPPELSGDTPILDIFQPMGIDLVKTLRHKVQFIGFYHLQSSVRHLFHAHKPLRLHHGFHRSVAAVMGAYRMSMRNYLYQKSLLLQIFHHGFSCRIAVHTGILAAQFIHGGVVIQDIDFFQIMPSSHLKVVRVVGGSNLHTACTELFIYIFIRYHRDLTVRQRKFQHFSNDILVALIGRIHGHGGITQQSLRAGSSDLHIASVFSDNWVIDMPEKAILILVLNLCVRQRGLAYRTPVDDTAALIDPSFFVQAHKHFFHGFGTALVHGKPLSVPIRGSSQLVQLIDDAAAVLLFPFPGILQELFPTDLMLIDSLLFQHISHLDLRRNSRVVGSRLPQRLIALHALITDQDILHGIVQRVSHVKLPGYIGRRHHNGKRFLVRINFSVEILLLQPFLIDAILHSFWIIGLCQFFAHNFLHSFL